MGEWQVAIMGAQKMEVKKGFPEEIISQLKLNLKKKKKKKLAGEMFPTGGTCTKVWRREGQINTHTDTRKKRQQIQGVDDNSK